MKNLTDKLLFSLIVILTASLVLISKYTSEITIFKGLSANINKQIIYQSITLLLTLMFLLLLKILKPNIFLQYFRKGDIAATILPEPMAGIKPKENENWFHFGRNFAIIISLVTGVVIYFQLINNANIQYSDVIKVLPFTLVFALSNSFVEESITRLGVVVVLKNNLSDKKIPIVSGIIFGLVHYFGNPGGIVGVIVAGFLGWLLAKSILETKGFFWAWLIHFLQDVIIFSALLIL